MAKNKYILASVGNIDMFNQNDGEMILSSKTLTESGLSFTASEQEIRGGFLNGLIGSYFSDSALTVTMSDATFTMEHLALNVGSSIQMSSEVMGIETIVTTEANTIEVTKEPKMFGNIGYIGWASIAGKDDWRKVTFDPSTKKASIADIPIGTKMCVKYIKEDATAEEMTVSSSFIPAQCYALLTLPLFKCSDSGATNETSSKVGEVQVEIPNFQFSGTAELSLTSSGNATTPLNGKALMVFDDSNCESTSGYYARVKKVVYNQDEFAEVKAIVIADSDIDLAPTEKQSLEVYAIYGGIKAPKKIDNSKITFTSDKQDVATVVNGEVEALTDGTAIIEAVITSKPTLVAKAVVTVETV